MKFSGNELVCVKYQVCKSFNSSELNNKVANENAVLNIVLDYDERFYLCFQKMSKYFEKIFDLRQLEDIHRRGGTDNRTVKSNFEL